jgi:hypothetical protein
MLTPPLLRGSSRSSLRIRRSPRNRPCLLGALEKFGSLIYKVNTQDQVEMYIHTTNKLMEYVASIYGKDMRNLVKYATERVFT